MEIILPSPSTGQVTVIDNEDEETVDPNSAVLNFYSQKPCLGTNTCGDLKEFKYYYKDFSFE